MTILFALIIVIISLVLYRCITIHVNNEYFKLDDIKKVKQYPPLAKDKLFGDVHHYENDNLRLGLDKCLEGCNGTCVEYGPTGAATCYPKSTYDQSSYQGIMRQQDNEYETEDSGKAEKLKFANMR